MNTIKTTVCVVGGGPAGLFSGLLLAQQGIDVLVLEKYPSFIRDFRGDTVHPSTMRAVRQLGLLDSFLKLPHSRVTDISMDTPSGSVRFADFSKLAKPLNFIAFMPQWDFLDFIASEAEKSANFSLLQATEVTDLVRDASGRVIGVRATSTEDGELVVQSRLVLGADGRHSVTRKAAGLTSKGAQSPMDVLWFRVDKAPAEKVNFLATGKGFVLITIDRGDYWQVAYVIPQGGYAAAKQAGLDALIDNVIQARPTFAGALHRNITTWDDVKFLSVRVDRLKNWATEGLLCIGDAAHAMSPAGGVGINLAVQDAIAAARILGPHLGPCQAEVPVRVLRRVQRRRQLAVRVVQFAQVHMMSDLYPKDTGTVIERPIAATIVKKFPFLTGWTAYFIGVGVTPESVPRSLQVDEPKPRRRALARFTSS